MKGRPCREKRQLVDTRCHLEGQSLKAAEAHPPTERNKGPRPKDDNRARERRGVPPYSRDYRCTLVFEPIHTTTRVDLNSSHLNFKIVRQSHSDEYDVYDKGCPPCCVVHGMRWISEPAIETDHVRSADVCWKMRWWCTAG